MASWYSYTQLRTFGIFRGHFVYFPLFGLLYQKNLATPVLMDAIDINSYHNI
jgi:hypothetical protein